MLPQFRIPKIPLPHAGRRTAAESRARNADMWALIYKENEERGKITGHNKLPASAFYRQGVPVGFVFQSNLYGDDATVTVVRLNEAPFDRPFRLKTHWDEYSIPMSLEEIMSIGAIQNAQE